MLLRNPYVAKPAQPRKRKVKPAAPCQTGPGLAAKTAPKAPLAPKGTDLPHSLQPPGLSSLSLQGGEHSAMQLPSLLSLDVLTSSQFGGGRGAPGSYLLVLGFHFLSFPSSPLCFLLLASAVRSFLSPHAHPRTHFVVFVPICWGKHQ